MYDSYRHMRVESAYSDTRIPSAVCEMQLKGLDADEKVRAQREAQKDIAALHCADCEYESICLYRNLPTRLPLLVKGGRGLCLRYFTEREGGKGFMQRNGEPFMMTQEAVEALGLSE